MGLFDFLKKKKDEGPEYDPLNVKVTDLQKGFVFEYDLDTWVVKDKYVYDWGNNYFSFEYKISNGKETLFLAVDEDDELELVLYRKVKVLTIDETLPDYIIDRNEPPKKLSYKGVTYFLDEESPGYFKPIDDGDEDWSELISWTYYDEEDKQVLAIEQWGEREFEAAQGEVIQEYQISNILPGENK